MGKSLIDNRLNEGDVEKLKALHQKIAPGTPLPLFGAPRQETLVMRDVKDRERIVGFIQMEESVEIRAMMTDPDYEHRVSTLTIAYNVMEGLLRTRGAEAYYITIPREHQHVRKFYEDDGAEKVDEKTVRFRKVL